jgi:hypothetical protein
MCAPITILIICIGETDRVFKQDDLFCDGCNTCLYIDIESNPPWIRTVTTIKLHYVFSVF